MIGSSETSKPTARLGNGRSETAEIAAALLRESTARRFRTLSHPARLRLIELLARGGKSVSELAEMTGLPADTVSKHLRVLASVNVVKRSQQGNYARYTMRDPELHKLVVFGYRGVMREAQRLQSLAELVPGRSDGNDVSAEGASKVV